MGDFTFAPRKCLTLSTSPPPATAEPRPEALSKALGENTNARDEVIWRERKSCRAVRQIFWRVWKKCTLDMHM